MICQRYYAWNLRLSCETTCESVWPPFASPYASLRRLASPFGQGFRYKFFDYRTRTQTADLYNFSSILHTQRVKWAGCWRKTFCHEPWHTRQYSMMWMPDCATFFISSAPRTCCHFSEWQDTPYPASSDFIKIKINFRQNFRQKFKSISSLRRKIAWFQEMWPRISGVFYAGTFLKIKIQYAHRCYILERHSLATHTKHAEYYPLSFDTDV